MMQQRQLRVSLVIPAYNEESHLAVCLDTIAAQTVKPFEVIVVDNNSTDNTAVVARSYPFVRVVTEAKQGLVFARNAGFNAARGDIIGRIDADTLLMPNWIETAICLFDGQACDAVSGSVSYYDIPFKWLVARIDLGFRQYMANQLGREVYLFGANMAIRRAAWQDVQGSLCHARHLHEDFDLAVHLAETQKYAVRFEPSLHAQVSARCMEYAPRSFYAYMLASPRTYAAHGLYRQRCMYWLTTFLLVMYFPLRILYRITDSTGHVSLKALFRSSYTPHVSPLVD